MPDNRDFPGAPPEIYATGDGWRSTAGSNYGDWRPAQPPQPHGYDFEKRFEPAGGGPAHDPDYQRLRAEHERELDEHYGDWLKQRYERFSDDFGRWRDGRYKAGTATPPR